MLKFKNQKTTLITILITAINTQNTTHFSQILHMLDNMISN